MTPQGKQQLKARFFGQHIGAKVKYINAMGESENIFEGLYWQGERFNASLDEGSVPLDKCKLILRPLSSITDEEAIAALTAATGLYLCDVDRNEDRIVAVGVNHSSCAVIWLKISVNQAGTFIQAWNDIKGHSQPDCHDYLAVDYLRSLNFCLPFNGIDPVEVGWAILETVNQPTGANTTQ